MADKKISQLTSATTPLAGTEVLPIVQSGSTVKVAVSDLTAGRTVDANKVTIGGGSNVQPLTVNGNGNIYASASATWYTGGDLYIRAGTSGNLRLGANNTNDYAYLTSSGYFVVGNTAAAGASQITAYNASNGQIAVQNSTNWSRLLQNSNDLYIDAGVGGSAGNIIFRRSSGTTENARIDTSGNYVPAAAAKGVNFTANTPAAGMTSQLLNWYEEGTWTTTLGPGVTVNSGSWAATATYTRIGRTVFWNVVQTSGNISASAGIEIFSGLPFAPARGSACTYTNAAVNLAGVGLAETNNKVYVAVTITSQTTLRFSGTYEV